MSEMEWFKNYTTSRHSSNLNVQANDQEADVAEIDIIIVKKISCLLLEPEFTLEELWKKVMKRLKEDNLRVYIRKLLIIVNILAILEHWKAKFSGLKSIDANLTLKQWNFSTNVYERKSIFFMQNCERDFIVKILGSIIGTLLEKFDIGTFELNCHEAELLPLEVGNTEGPIDDTNYRKDHSKLKVVMKDCLDSLWRKLHFKKVELEEVLLASKLLVAEILFFR
ncbi:hypothetical protein C1646_757430 [Rhizophagus diaphanus]|nr:hypothetical protein C1646_757430 [Rhizophagus diaphanus] [Rhizophagus sp. MUCL 43196]